MKREPLWYTAAGIFLLVSSFIMPLVLAACLLHWAGVPL